MRLRRSTRLLTLLLAAIQFAAPAALSVVDGTVASSERVSGAHFEAFGQNKCTPPHSADCAICRFLSTTHGQVATGVSGVVLSRIVAVPAARVAYSASFLRFGFDSRAPPTVLG
jgi:hypothetical protein